MESRDLSRRDFSKLSVAALGGALSGALIGCEGGKEGDKGDKGTPAAETHLCRGLNACKGKGKGGGNACAGRGKCATAKEHACAGKNECKGQGGCQGKVGKNDCKEKGGCAVPLMDNAWKVARTEFEAKMKADGKEYGDAPPKA